jgi:hypothetical protein
MHTSTTFGAAMLAAALAASPVAAQPGQAPPGPVQPASPPLVTTAPAAGGETPRPRDQTTDARFKVRVMEGVLERAVEHAAMVMNQQLRTVSPDLVLLTGAARARGYRLDGYGLFFDVQVPAALRQSMGWTVRMMRQNTEGVDQALTLFKRMVGGLQGKARDDAEMALRQIELQVRPPLGPDSGLGSTVPPLFSLNLPNTSGMPVATPASTAAPMAATTVTPAPAVAESTTPASSPGPPAEQPTVEARAGAPEPATPAAAPPEAPRPVPVINPLLVQNPDLAYELEVREALIGAMVEWGATLPLESTEWFTVAARDNEDVVIPGEAADVVTIIMRVRGSDLADFRAGRLTAADVRKRVEVREF